MEALVDLRHLKTQEIQLSFCNSLEVIVNDAIGQPNIDLDIELEIYDRIFRHIVPRTCLDIGANIGSHTVFFSSRAKQVYSFEPNPFIFPVLLRNIERHCASGKAFSFGLSNHPEHNELHVPLWGNTGNASFFPENTWGKSRAVRATLEAGDELCRRESIHDVDFIKIDTEGYEARVILGLEDTITQNQPLICLEWTMPSTRADFLDNRETFHWIFKGYTAFALGSPWNKPCYPGIKRIKRWIMKNALRMKRPPICLQPFSFTSSCEILYLVPERFSKLTALFSFTPKTYQPKPGNFSELFPM